MAELTNEQIREIYRRTFPAGPYIFTNDVIQFARAIEQESRRAATKAPAPAGVMKFPKFEDWLASDIEPPAPGLPINARIIAYARLAFSAGRAPAGEDAREQGDAFFGSKK